jgi:hypothetical protein
MSNSVVQVVTRATQSARRRAPITYFQARELARQIVLQEVRQQGSSMSDDEIEAAAAKRAAKVYRQFF